MIAEPYALKHREGIKEQVTTLRNRPCARASRSRCQHHRKTESQHRVIDCCALRNRLPRSRPRTTTGRMVVRR